MRTLGITLALLALSPILNAQETKPLIKSLVFHAPFDGTADAVRSQGDGKIFTAESLARKQKTPGLVRPHVEIAKGQGKYGDCLRSPTRARKFYALRAVRFRIAKRIGRQRFLFG